jgi:ATP-binding cassette, subfamily B (MDR/TAP), member 1
VDIKELNVRDLRGCIGAVQQDPGLLDRSILENIAHGLLNSPAADEKEVIAVLDGTVAAFASKVTDSSKHKHSIMHHPSTQATSFDAVLASESDVVKSIVGRVVKAATIADAIGFINNLEHGLATSIGSAGSQLSGGQKQRIALARAMMRDPAILLLDEATSALDSRSERQIQKALKQATEGRTTISIVHRLSTVKDADNIIVMRSGKILEQGTHQELMAADDTYASMVRLQNVSQAQSRDLNAAAGEPGDEITPFSEHAVVSEKQGMTRTPSNASGDEKDTSQDPASPNEKSAEAVDTTKSKRGVLNTIAGVASLTRPQALILLLAFTASAVVGGSYSGEAVIFGHTVSAFSACNSVRNILRSGSFWGLLFFILALIELFANMTMGSLFGMVSEKTLFKIRVLSYRTLMGQDVDWHDSDGRNPSVLLAYITTDANALAGLTGTTLGTLFSIIVNTIAGIALSHAIAWRIAVVLLACIPVLLGSGFMRLRVFANFHAEHAKAFASATGYAVEAVNSIRTIAMFSLEEEAVKVYHRALQAPYDATLKAILWSNLWLASAYSISNLVYALAYWWGSQNIIEGRYSQTQFFIVLPALLFSAQTCGQLFALAPDFSKSRVSAAKLLDLLDTGKESMTITEKALHSSSSSSSASSVDEKDLENGDGRAMPLAEMTAGRNRGVAVSFRNVHFAYPARPHAPVLRGLSLDIQPGQFCALVGPSGAGKSTIISLLERFFRPSAGVVEIDGRNLSDFVGADFRDGVALVPQDSVLFEGTLRFNLSLGARPGHDATDEEIEEACRLANIYDTIMALPDGFDTRCGPNGNAFSGGQRQRLSIARALLRKPRLLLLDESTSALDSESERMVQDALESVRKGVTVIAIAHRLHTIEKADRIFVVEEGRCTAMGTHEELLRNSETYRTNALHQVLGD